MKIIFSPAKSLNLDKPVDSNWIISDKTKEILTIIKAQKKDELKEILRVSDKILAENIDYIKGFDKDISYRAVEMYNGLAYKYLDIASMGREGKNYLKENLLILSALYGPIEAYSLIKPYRLDFNSKLKLNGKSLKLFWRDSFNQKVEEGEVIVNLASKEFSSLFDRQRYEWIDFDFYELKSASKKRSSSISKKARGHMLRYLAQNNIKDVKEVKYPIGFDSIQVNLLAKANCDK